MSIVFDCDDIMMIVYQGHRGFTFFSQDYQSKAQMSQYALQDTPDWDDPTIMMVPMPGYYYVYLIN